MKYHNGDRIISDEKVDFSEWTPTTSTTEIITTSSNEATTSTTEVITSTTEAITSTTTEETTTDDDYTGCGINQGCFGYPSNCVASKSCTILLTFVQQVENGGVDFNLISSSMTNRYRQIFAVWPEDHNLESYQK